MFNNILRRMQRQRVLPRSRPGKPTSLLRCDGPGRQASMKCSKKPPGPWLAGWLEAHTHAHECTHTHTRSQYVVHARSSAPFTFLELEERHK